MRPAARRRWRDQSVARTGGKRTERKNLDRRAPLAAGAGGKAARQAKKAPRGGTPQADAREAHLAGPLLQELIFNFRWVTLGPACSAQQFGVGVRGRWRQQEVRQIILSLIIGARLQYHSSEARRPSPPAAPAPATPCLRMCSRWASQSYSLRSHGASASSNRSIVPDGGKNHRARRHLTSSSVVAARRASARCGERQTSFRIRRGGGESQFAAKWQFRALKNVFSTSPRQKAHAVPNC
jgi:hypothetical protein